MATTKKLALLSILATFPACTSTADPAVLDEWQFVEDFRIGGGADDPDGLSDLKGILSTRSGNIWALEASTQNIRVFDSLGKPLRTIGRRGQGPGEFLWPDGMALAPDGVIWVHDPQNGRFSLFSETGDFLTQQIAPAQGRAWVWTGGIDRAGRIWDEVFGHLEGDEPKRTLRRAEPDWSRADTVSLPSCRPPGWTSGDGSYWKPLEGSRGGARYSVGIPFYPGPVLAFDWAGGAVWCAPTGAEYRMFKLGIEQHDTVARIHRGATPLPVTPAERDSAIAGIRKFLASINEPDPDWSRIPTVKPVIQSAFVDDAARLWVQRGTVDGTSLFEIHSAGGGAIAEVRIPHTIISWVRPVTRDNVVWLAARDRDGIPYIVRGRIGP